MCIYVCMCVHVYTSVQFSSVQSLSHVQLFVTPWIAARQASLSITSSQSPLKPMSIESVMPSNHLILHYPLLLLPPIPPSIRVFSKESIYIYIFVFVLIRILQRNRTYINSWYIYNIYMYYKECNILNIQNILYIHYKEVTRRTTETEKFHHQSSAIQRLRKTGAVIQAHV